MIVADCYLRRLALLTGLSAAVLAAALADRRLVLPPAQLVEACARGVAIGREDLLRAMLPGFGGVLGAKRSPIYLPLTNASWQTLPYNVMVIELWGGGGGGQGSGSNAGTAGASVHITNFDASLTLIANGGGVTNGGATASGGTASGGDINTTGGGTSSSTTGGSAAQGGAGGTAGNPGIDPGGGGGALGSRSDGGGAAGGYCKITLTRGIGLAPNIGAVLSFTTSGLPGGVAGAGGGAAGGLARMKITLI